MVKTLCKEPKIAAFGNRCAGGKVASGYPQRCADQLLDGGRDGAGETKGHPKGKGDQSKDAEKLDLADSGDSAFEKHVSGHKGQGGKPLVRKGIIA